MLFTLWSDEFCSQFQVPEVVELGWDEGVDDEVGPVDEESGDFWSERHEVPQSRVRRHRPPFLANNRVGAQLAMGQVRENLQQNLKIQKIYFSIHAVLFISNLRKL